MRFKLKSSMVMIMIQYIIIFVFDAKLPLDSVMFSLHSLDCGLKIKFAEIVKPKDTNKSFQINAEKMSLALNVVSFLVS